MCFADLTLITGKTYIVNNFLYCLPGNGNLKFSISEGDAFYIKAFPSCLKNEFR